MSFDPEEVELRNQDENKSLQFDSDEEVVKQPKQPLRDFHKSLVKQLEKSPSGEYNSESMR
jgi:hypothetical protein